MFEEESSEKRGKKLIKIGGLILTIILIFVLVQKFFLKPKKTQPNLEIQPFILTNPEEIEKAWQKEEKIEIQPGFFIRLIGMEDYILEKVTPSQGFKFFSLEIEYENKSKEAIRPLPFYEWLILSTEDKSFIPIPPRPYTEPAPLAPIVRKPALLMGERKTRELPPEITEKGYVSFQVPENMKIKEVIFKNPFKKITFQIP